MNFNLFLLLLPLPLVSHLRIANFNVIKFGPMSSSTICTALGLMFRFLIQFDVIFYMELGKSPAAFLCMRIASLSSTICCKD